MRAWLSEAVEAKAVVTARLAASIRAAIASLAADAGIRTDRSRARSSTARLAGPPSTARPTSSCASSISPQSSARPLPRREPRRRARGAGPLGFITSRLYRYSGRESRVADPAGFLSRWRERGTLAPATEAIRAALNEPLRTAAPAIRPVIAASTDPSGMEVGLVAAVDRAVALRGRDIPTSRAWPVIGLFQTIATVALVLAAAWVVLWILIRFPVDSVRVPILGLVPAPLVFLVGAIVAGYLIARLLRLHAGFVGRRWARGLQGDVRAGVTREVEASAFVALDTLETARNDMWAAASAAARECG